MIEEMYAKFKEYVKRHEEGENLMYARLNLLYLIQSALEGEGLSVSRSEDDSMVWVDQEESKFTDVDIDNIISRDYTFDYFMYCHKEDEIVLLHFELNQDDGIVVEIVVENDDVIYSNFIPFRNNDKQLDELIEFIFGHEFSKA